MKLVINDDLLFAIVDDLLAKLVRDGKLREDTVGRMTDDYRASLAAIVQERLES